MATLSLVLKSRIASRIFALQLLTLLLLLLNNSSSVESNNSISRSNNENSLNHNLPNSRNSRAVEVSLNDPLDCLSQLVCGLNSFPPRVPSQNTAVANDYAYLLRTVILRLKKLPRPPPTPKPTNVTIISEQDGEQNDDEEESSEEDFNDDEEEDEEEEEASDEVETKEETSTTPRTKNQDGDIANMFDLHPPFGLFRSMRAIKSKTQKKKKVSKAPSIPTTPLQKLRMETDIREKLRSDATCLHGILNHTCPFRYEELMVLMSGVLERQRVISYNTNKVLPMVGYLLKSRSLTETLKATFSALEKINNVTITKDTNHEEISFNNIYDEITRGEIGIGNGIKIVETKNDDATSQAWEDDEFDDALHNPFIKREEIKGYNSFSKNDTTPKKKTSSEENDDEEEDEEVSDENQRPPPPRPSSIDSLGVAILPGRPQGDTGNSGEDSGSQEDSSSFKDVPLPPLYGIMSHREPPVFPKKHRRRNHHYDD